MDQTDHRPFAPQERNDEAATPQSPDRAPQERRNEFRRQTGSNFVGMCATGKPAASR
jgi:hypothetical protein